jgi:hypothetical protein
MIDDGDSCLYTGKRERERENIFQGTPTHGHGVPNLYLLHSLLACMQVAALANILSTYSIYIYIYIYINLIVMLVDRPRPAGE